MDYQSMLHRIGRLVLRMAMYLGGAAAFVILWKLGVKLPSDSVGAYLCSIGTWACLVVVAWSGAILITKGGDK